MKDSPITKIPTREIFLACLKKYKPLVIIGCLILVVFSTMIALLWQAHLHNSDILLKGEKVTGKVFTKKAEPDENGLTEHRIVYNFPAMINANTDPVETFGEQILQQDYWETIKIDDPIEIAYDKTNPQRNLPVVETGINSRFLVLLLTVLLSFFVGFGILILYGFIFNLVLYMSKLLNSGIHTQAKITRIEKRAGNILHYEFEDQSGEIHQGVTGDLPDVIAEQWLVGQTGAICYDPLKPKKNLWYADDWKKYLL